jgi:hypothetical protein
MKAKLKSFSGERLLASAREISRSRKVCLPALTLSFWQFPLRFPIAFHQLAGNFLFDC